MKKLRLSSEEWERMLKDISIKFHEDCNRNISDFEYTKEDINKFTKNLTEENGQYPVIHITSDAYVKMYELVNQSSVEIQWHGLVEKNNNTYTIYDILVFPQTNAPASTSSDQDEFAEWQTELIMDMSFPINNMRLHGHSHVNMNVYSSSIDDGYQSELITKVDDGDFYIFLVLNKRMEMYPLLYDFNQQILFEGKDIKIKILDKNNNDIKEWCSEQIKKYCKTENKNTWKSLAATTYTSKPKTNLNLENITDLDNYIANIIEKPKSRKRR